MLPKTLATLIRLAEEEKSRESPPEGKEVEAQEAPAAEAGGREDGQ